MAERATRKIGSEIVLSCLYKEGGQPVDLTGKTVTSTLRTAGKAPKGRIPIANFSYTMDPDQTANKGKFRLTIAAVDSAKLPAGVHRTDVKVASGSQVRFTGTYELELIHPETE